MKKVFYLFLVFAFLSCGMSTTELEEAVKQNIIEQLNENPDAKGTEVVDFQLVHKGGNEYKGVIDLIIPNPVADLMNDWSEQDILKKNIEVTYMVEVIYDGNGYSWQIITD